jgi:hypothetical protein
VQNKVHLRTGHEGPEAEKFYSFFNFGNEGGWSTPRSGRFNPGNDLEGPHIRFGRVRKISSPPGFDPRTAQPAANHYNDYANTAPIILR